MSEWWESLTSANQALYGCAAFFSVLLVWQLFAALSGLGPDHDDFTADASDSFDTAVSFELISFRSILSFFTLFTWGSALYMNRGLPVSRALGLGAAWGLAGMLVVSAIVWSMRRLVYVGTRRLSSCVGQDATVYLDIPADGLGEIRTLVGGMVSHVRARSKDSRPLKAGTPVHVVGLLGQNTVVVRTLEGGKGTDAAGDT